MQPPQEYERESRSIAWDRERDDDDDDAFSPTAGECTSIRLARPLVRHSARSLLLQRIDEPSPSSSRRYGVSAEENRKSRERESLSRVHHCRMHYIYGYHRTRTQARYIYIYMCMYVCMCVCVYVVCAYSLRSFSGTVVLSRRYYYSPRHRLLSRRSVEFERITEARRGGGGRRRAGDERTQYSPSLRFTLLARPPTAYLSRSHFSILSSALASSAYPLSLPLFSSFWLRESAVHTE